MQKRIDLSELADVNIQSINKEDLIDVSEIKLNPVIPKERRAAQLLEVVKNPYCVKLGDMVIKLEFLDNAPPLQSCLINFFMRKKGGF